MEKFVCIHAHFYQPPRENPWLEAVELQDSAYPFHDWNERVTAECYGPNATARMVDGEGRVRTIVNNYSRISFNFGPTLLAWLKDNAREVYAAIIEADRQSRNNFSGHGSALAQCYNHIIMPLAHSRDRHTQVLWGIADFEARFGRKPEGMWLPETAADDESLDALAEHGIRFTILSPYQASHIRPLDGRKWQEVSGGHFDYTRPYLIRLASGRSISVFFYDAPIARAVAFERLLNDGEHLAQRLTQYFDPDRRVDQLIHIATDGESYGHHHRYGEMALAYALEQIESQRLARLTNYGEFLETHPAKWEAKIHQKSAWSCAHGVERWRSDCGCNSGGRPGWNQRWREPLRHALDWLRDQLAPQFEIRGRDLLKDPWLARDDYISVILDRSEESIGAFFRKHGVRPLNPEEQVTALRLLEMQRHAMLMYTSCGWFFDELSGIETVQIIQYAARAIQLANDLLGANLEPGFVDRLAAAKSNLREHRNGRTIFEKFVKPAIIDREKVGAHFAVSSLFEPYPDKTRIYSFTIDQEEREVRGSGNARLAVGRLKVTFEVTRNSDVISYGVLHLGEHHLNCGVRHYRGPEAYAQMAAEMNDAFDRANFAQLLRLMDQHFGESNYSLQSLFRDEQRKVLDQILAATRDDVYKTFRSLTDRYTPLLRFLASLNLPVPEDLRVAAQSALNGELRRHFEGPLVSLERVRSLLSEAERDHAPLDVDALGYAVKMHVERLAAEMEKRPDDLDLLTRFVQVAELFGELPFEVNLWKAQNVYFKTFQALYGKRVSLATDGDEFSRQWVRHFTTLGERFGFARELFQQ